MAVLENNPANPESVEGSFFDAKSWDIQERFAKQSDLFLIRYGDLLVGDVSRFHYVSQFSQTPAGEHVQPGDAPGTVTTLQFSAHDEYYVWDITEAESSVGRLRSQVVVNAGRLVAKQTVYNTQGIKGETKDMPDTEQWELLKTVQDALASDYFQNRVTGMRERREKAQHELGLFSIREVARLGYKKYQKDLVSKQKILEKVGFTSTAFDRI